MKKHYTPMDVRTVGVVSTVVAKSGTYCDNSSQHESHKNGPEGGECAAVA